MSTRTNIMNHATNLYLLLVLLAAIGIRTAPAHAEALPDLPAAGQPNIVFLLADNLGYGEPGCYGGGILRGAATPRIDRLASEGLRLLNYNVEAQCTPSRSSNRSSACR